MKEENNNNAIGLPPSKRFKLFHLNHQQHQLNHPDPNPKCLPAKKRLNSYENHHHYHQSSSSICLPAKKRVWAPHPLSPTKLTPQQEEKQPKTTKNDVDNGTAQEKYDDDGVACAVCQSADGDCIDPIVFCDGCDLMVHASCYGNPLITSIPEGDWFCEKCKSNMQNDKNNGKSDRECCLCPVKGGALKLTNDGQWAHIVCALLVPEVFFKDPEGRDAIECSQIPRQRWKKRCYLCKKSGIGCVIECSEMKCGLGFHVSCGLELGFCFEYKEGRGGTVIASFCEEHTQLWKKQQLTGKFKIVARQQKTKI